VLLLLEVRLTRDGAFPLSSNRKGVVPVDNKKMGHGTKPEINKNASK
jgi:hypothetical protein